MSSPEKVAVKVIDKGKLDKKTTKVKRDRGLFTSQYNCGGKSVIWPV